MNSQRGWNVAIICPRLISLVNITAAKNEASENHLQIRKEHMAFADLLKS